MTVDLVRNKLKSTEHFWMFMDAHDSHLCDKALDLLEENNIHTMFLPAHLSHLLQPNDRGPNAFFKKLQQVAYHTVLRWLCKVERFTLPLTNKARRTHLAAASQKLRCPWPAARVRG